LTYDLDYYLGQRSFSSKSIAGHTYINTHTKLTAVPEPINKLLQGNNLRQQFNEEELTITD